MPTISVIIPTYNRRHLIGQTLHSILAQTLPPSEIIVVDDGSTDGTIEWLEKNYGAQLLLVKNKGKGPGAARNTGLAIAKGEYIKFFDSDDWMSPNSLEVQLKALETTGKPYVTSPYIYAQEINGQWTPTDSCIINHYGFPQHKPLTHWMIWGLFICIPTMLFRRDFLDKVGPWPEEVTTSEDWLYLWRMAMEEPYPAHTNECWFYYRVHQLQSTGSNMVDSERDKEKADVLQLILNNDVQNGTFTWFEKQLFRNKFYQMARVSSHKEFKEEMNKIARPWRWFVWQYYRIKMKMGRKRTGTEWQPMHAAKVMEKN